MLGTHGTQSVNVWGSLVWVTCEAIKRHALERELERNLIECYHSLKWLSHVIEKYNQLQLQLLQSTHS